MPIDKDIIASIAANDEKLTELDLSYQTLKDDDLKQLCSALEKNQSLTKINLNSKDPEETYPPLSITVKRGLLKKPLVFNIPHPKIMERDLMRICDIVASQGFSSYPIKVAGRNMETVRALCLTLFCTDQYLSSKGAKSKLHWYCVYNDKEVYPSPEVKEAMQKEHYKIFTTAPGLTSLLKKIELMAKKDAFHGSSSDKTPESSVGPNEFSPEAISLLKDVLPKTRIIELDLTKSTYGGSSYSILRSIEEILAKNKALPSLIQRAESGDAKAQVELSNCYEKGLGVKQDNSKAVALLIKAAEAKAVPAIMAVATCYDTGRLVVSKDLAQAFQWYQRAALQGDSTAQYQLGQRYENGTGVGVNRSSAMEWYLKAAAQGNSHAGIRLKALQQQEEIEKIEKKATDGDVRLQCDIARRYEIGQDVEKNPSRAFLWYHKASQKGDKEAQSNLGRCYENGIGTEKNYLEAVICYQKAAAQGDTLARDRLSALSISAAAQALILKGEAGDAEAYYQLGEGFYYGYSSLTASKNESLSFECCLKAAILGHAKAQGDVGTCYSTSSRGVKKDDAKAFEWYLKAVTNSKGPKVSAYIKYYLAEFYAKGRGTQQNFTQALDWYKKAADEGDVDAQCKVGEYYINGTAGKKDYAQAYTYYQMAADKGNDAACAGLKLLKEKGYSPPPITAEVKSTPAAEKSLTHPSSPARQEIKTEPKDEMASAVSFEINYDQLTFSKELGRGGFGVVYQGTWRFNNVAIKQLLTKSLSTDALEEFNSESRIMAQLRSEYVVQFYGRCVTPTYCLVMQYMPKGSLFNLLRSSEPLDWSLRYRMLTDIACGLAFLHASNIFHRDLKSLNVLLDENYRTKLCDFGLSKVKKENQSTATMGGPVGTLPWMAPELFERRAIFTAKADIYSLAMTLWEIASRKIPFADASSPSLIPMWVTQGQREEIPSDTPPKISSLIRCCWHADPAKRPTAAEVVTYLRSDQTEFKSTGAVPSASTTTSIQGNLVSGVSSDLGSSSSVHANLMSVPVG